MRFPAICTGCGRVSIHNAIEINANIKRFRFYGNTATCPSCGGIVNFVEGIFQLEGGQLTPIEVVPTTAEILERFNLLAEQVKRGEITPDKAQEEAAAIAPSFAWLLNPNWISLFLSIYAIYLAHSSAQSTNEHQETIEQMLENILDAIERNDGVLPENTLQQDDSEKPIVT